MDRRSFTQSLAGAGLLAQANSLGGARLRSKEPGCTGSIISTTGRATKAPASTSSFLLRCRCLPSTSVLSACSRP